MSRVDEMLNDLPWASFKGLVDSKVLNVQWRDVMDCYWLKAFDGPFQFGCMIPKLGSPGADQVDFEANYKDVGNKSVSQEVVTQLEKRDKDLVLASAQGDFVGNLCTLQVKIPGELGDMSGRMVAGGYGFTDIYGWNDRITKVQMIDVEFVYAGLAYPATPIEAGIPDTEGLSWADIMPDGVILGSYVDEDCLEINRGWRLWADDGGQGGVDIDPLGGFGMLPAQAYLSLVFEKTVTSGATHAAINLWWGRKTV